MRSLFAFFIMCCFGNSHAIAQNHLWIEAEKSIAVADIFQTGGWGNSQYLSNGQWVFLTIEPEDVEKKLPLQGITLRYDFSPIVGGKQDLWLRIGYEFARTRFRWRHNDKPWSTVEPTALTTDLMAIADFAEVSWLKVGELTLTEARQSIEIQIPRPEKQESGQYPRVLFALDCLMVGRDFLPNGPHQPNAKWQTIADERASQAIFEITAPPRDSAISVQLTGAWQVARFDEPGDVIDRTKPLAALPKNLDQLHWKAIQVPSDKDSILPEFQYCHRLLYRTKFRVPKRLQNHSFRLRFPNNALLSTVFVNGKSVGHSNTPCAPFTCDATEAVRPGEVNELVVCIKDLYYAIAKTGDGKSCRYLFNYPTERFHTQGGLGPTRYADYPVLFKVRRSGILEAPQFIISADVYIADTFCIPNVRDKSLSLEVTVRNRSSKARELFVRAEIASTQIGNDKLLSFPSQAVRLEPGQEKVLTLKQSWPNVELWWPHDPQMYLARPIIEEKKQILEIALTPFGFREWGIAGNTMTLNGVPWQLRADLRHNTLAKETTPEEAVAEWKKHGQTMMRFWGDIPWTGPSQQATLDFFDKAGVPVRRSGIFDGEVASYLLVQDGKVNQALFDNWREQVAAWVKAERNHPCIFTWSLENEITYINARNFGWLDQVEPEVQKAAEMVRQLDPTRPSMIDGGNALRNQSLPIYGNHYLEKSFSDYPAEAYTLQKSFEDSGPTSRDNPWPLDKQKPLFLGESFFANGFPAAAYSEIMGDVAFLGRSESGRGVARLARYLSEGYRWAGVAGFHFWFAGNADAEHYQAWQPICVLCKEWDSVFQSPQTLTRTLKAFNDSAQSRELNVYWLLQTRDGRHQVRGKKSLQLPAGSAQEFAIELLVPDLKSTTPQSMDFVLTCSTNGQEVFRDIRTYTMLPKPKLREANSAKPDEIVVYDPQNKNRPLLQELLGNYSTTNDWRQLPANCRVLIVGSNAIQASEANNPEWAAHLAQGRRLLILDQEHPLNYVAIPADTEVTDQDGFLAHIEDRSHPVFREINQVDPWIGTGHELLFRKAYRKPTRGGRSLLHCGPELSNTPLLESRSSRGTMLLCQLDVTTRPTALTATLLRNMIDYCWSYSSQSKTTQTILPADDLRLDALQKIGLQFQNTNNLLMALSKAEVVIADASSENLVLLNQEQEAISAFFDRGGQLMLWGLEQQNLSEYNQFVGVDHALRPFGMERVTLARQRPSIAAGLTQRDVALESAEKIYAWAGDRYPESRIFSNIVDLNDIAPFCKSPNIGTESWQKITNGLTSADSWKFIFYHDQSSRGEKPSWVVNLPRQATVTGMSIVINADYRKLTKLRIRFDSQESDEILNLKPTKELRQIFTWKARQCQQIRLEPLSWEPGEKPIIGLDTLTIKVDRGADFAQKVQPLLNIGGLVYYPKGKGGVLLNQLRILPSEANPSNTEKKHKILSALLRNWNCGFNTDRLWLPTVNLKYGKINFGESCNAYLSTKNGWLKDQPDLPSFPLGEQRFNGVPFVVRDFKTSPLPSAIMLAGNPAQGITAKEVTVPVKQTAEALFFVHSFHQTRSWEPSRSGEEPPIVWEYVLNYNDGSTDVIPVRLQRDVRHWNVAKVTAPTAGTIAWTSPFPNGPKDRQAVVYQVRWISPNPKKVIQNMTIRYPNDSQVSYGIPIVFAATAADESQ